MNPLKFRVWYEDMMIFSDCPIGEYEFVFNADGAMEFHVWNDEIHKLTSDGDQTFAGFEYYTSDIMMSAGLNDKNNVEIYEGDIVDCNRYSNNEIYQVVIKDIRRLPADMFGSNLNSLEVVGNIHDDKSKDGVQVK